MSRHDRTAWPGGVGCWLLAIALVPHSGVSAQDDKPFAAAYEAVVYADSARFVFPAATRDEFVWWDSAGRNSLHSFTWSVSFPRASGADGSMALWVWLPGVGFESYRVRYRESRPIPEGTQRGTLADLVAAAETSVHWVSGHVASPMPHLRAESRVEEGRVVLLLVGRESVVEVLGARPDTAWFHRIDINEIDGSAVAVLITYVDGLE